MVFFFFKQKTAYEMRISDWSSDVCSSDLASLLRRRNHIARGRHVDGGTINEERAFVGNGDEALLSEIDRTHMFASGQHCDNEQIGRASCRERVCQYV